MVKPFVAENKDKYTRDKLIKQSFISTIEGDTNIFSPNEVLLEILGIYPREVQDHFGGRVTGSNRRIFEAWINKYEENV